MSRKIFRNLISTDEAKNIFESALPAVSTDVEELKLTKALGRVLSRDVYATLDIPPFDRSAMDGFAVISTDTTGAEEDRPVILRVVGELKAGYVYDELVEPGTCVEISTGAPLPSGCDAVVMVEFTERDADVVSIFKAVSPNENTMSAGGDIQLGERVLKANTILTSREMAVLAAIGKQTIGVFTKPKIAVFSSGDEIISPGGDLQPGKLYDINSTAIITSILENGGDPHFLGILEDTYSSLADAMRSAVETHDMVVVSGGTSAGMGDMLYQIIDELGEPGLLVHGVKVKPGKPTILGVCDDTPVIGLPGYPASALSIFQLFVLPVIRLWAHLPPLEHSRVVMARINRRLRSVEGRYEFKPVYLFQGHEEYYAYPVPGGSGAITSVALADGFVHIPEDTNFLPAGSQVDVHLLSNQIRLPSIQIIGSHDLALGHLMMLYEENNPGSTIRSVAVGSNGGVAAVRRGEAHLAGVHLLDPEYGYNQWIKDELEVSIIPGYYRMQGLITTKGNPKKIETIGDLQRKDVQFLNRNVGSGTRILLDSLLSTEEIDPEQINGYDRTARSHSAVAQSVKQGLVDVSIGIEYVANMEDLHFIPLKEEEYDFILHNDYINHPAVSEFINELNSESFGNYLTSLPGYRTKQT